MRRLLILSLIFVIMYGLQFLQVGSETTFNPLSLATFGFVLLAAYTIGELAAATGLPRITGFIATGVVFGPYVVNLFSLGVVQDLQGINNLAIGLIAVTAGGEMKLESLKKVARSIGFIVLFKGLLTISLVTAAVWLIADLIPFLAGQSTGLILAVGAIFGILAFGTSPAATIAVINETGARGRLTDTTLGTAVVKDVVMVVLLALAIAMAKLYSSPDALFEPEALIHVAHELSFSLLAGSVLGGIVIAYIRFVHAEMWLFIIGLVFAGTAIAELLHLEALLMFITAGFVVQNFSRFGEELIHPIENVALPVYVVFFSIAGAGLDLQALQTVWQIALILFGVRLVAIFLGTRLATIVAGEPESIRTNAWLSFISQAGVVLGLSLIVEKSLPGLGAEIKIIVIGTIALNLFLGPVTFKIALSRMRETADKREDKSPASLATAAGSEAARPQRELPKPLKIMFPEPSFDAAMLNGAIDSLRWDLITLENELSERSLETQLVHHQQLLETLRTQIHDRLSELTTQVTQLPQENLQARDHLIRQCRVALARRVQEHTGRIARNPNRLQDARQIYVDFFNTLGTICENVENTFTLPLEAKRLQAQVGDSAYIRFRKFLLRLSESIRRTFGSGGQRQRTVNFRKLAKFHFIGKLPGEMKSAAHLAGGMTNFVLQKYKVLFGFLEESIDKLLDSLWQDRLGPESAFDLAPAVDIFLIELEAEIDQISEDFSTYIGEAAQRFNFALSRVYVDFLHALALDGTFELPARMYRFSLVYEASERVKSDIAESFEAWSELDGGVAGNLTKHIEVVVLIDDVSRAVDEAVYTRSSQVLGELRAAIAASQRTGHEVAADLELEFQKTRSVSQLDREIANQRDVMVGILQRDGLARIEQLRHSPELTGFVNILLQELTAIADRLPAECMLISEADFPEPGVLREGIKLKQAPLRDLALSYLETEIARDLAEVNRFIVEMLDRSLQVFQEALQVVEFNLNSAIEELKSQEKAGIKRSDTVRARIRELGTGGTERVIARLHELAERVLALEHQIHEKSGRKLDKKIKDLDALIADQAEIASLIQIRQIKVTRTGKELVRQLRHWLSHRSVKIRRLVAIRLRPFAQEAVADIRQTLGLHQYTAGEILAAFDQARLDDEIMSSLPFIYQKLFEIAPLTRSEFLVAREEELAMIQDAKQRWLQGLPAAVAIIGEPGSGKTSFINIVLESAFSDCRVHRLSNLTTLTTEASLVQALGRLLGKSNLRTTDELLAFLERLPPKTVITIEDTHKLFLRVVGGFAAIKKLMLLIANSSHHVLWILSIREYAWHYLNSLFQIAGGFTHIINTENLTREELQQVIVVRNRVSGFALRFQASEMLRQRRRYRRADSQDKSNLAGEEFFEELRKITDGNILAAIFYWLKSIRAVEDDVLVIQPLREIRLDFLQNLPITKLLSLALIVQHGSLTIAEHAGIFGWDTDTSEALMTQLTNVNLLTRIKENNGASQYGINRLVYKPLSRTLATMNILQR